MAEFGAQATQLSAPSLAGTAPVGPVETQYVNTNGAAATLIDAAGSIFDGAVKKMQKNAAQEAQDTVVGGYIKTENQIADAVKTGQITASAGAARSRANFSQYAASNPAYIKELKQAGEALKGYGDTGEVQRQVEEANEQRKKNISDASQRGFVFPENAPKEVVDAQIASYQTSLRADEATRRMIQQNQEIRAQAAEGRAQSAEERTIMDRQRKEASLTAINEIAGSNINSYSVLGKSLVDSVSKGTMPVEQAQQLWAQQGAQIQAAIQSAASLNPELANGYRSVFSELDSVIKAQIDPKTRTEQAENQVKAIIANAKLIGLADPKVAASVATSALFGNAPELAFKLSGDAIKTVDRISQTLTTDGKISGFVPPVVGNPDVEKPTLDLLKGAISKIDAPTTLKNDLLKNSCTNSVNVCLKQTGDLINSGVVAPASLVGMADFVASHEYGKLMASGGIDKQSAQTAKKVFQLMYEPAIIQGVQEKMDSFLYNSSYAATGGSQAFLFGGQKDYGTRPDGTRKGAGFLGELKRPDGNISTEISVGVNIGGKEMDIPTLVPTLSKDEVKTLLSIPEGQPIPESIVRKAAMHAKQRIAEGKSVFADEPKAGPKAFADTVDVVWTGSGIQFQPKNTTGLTDGERMNQKASMASLDSSTKAINQLIHIGAHMEGTTDYQKYWEDNKHIYMPKMFSRYKGIDIGTIKDGYRYMGGNINDQKNWAKVNGDGE